MDVMGCMYWHFS